MTAAFKEKWDSADHWPAHLTLPAESQRRLRTVAKHRRKAVAVRDVGALAPLVAALARLAVRDLSAAQDDVGEGRP